MIKLYNLLVFFFFFLKKVLKYPIDVDKIFNLYYRLLNINILLSFL